MDTINPFTDRERLKQALLERAAIKGYKKFEIDNPRTWCEKIQWLQINDDKNPLKSLCADKIRVHDYCKEKLGKDICVPILKVYDSPNDLDFSELPQKFVLKCNHGWNMNIVVENKDEKDRDECVDKLKTWLEVPFGLETVEPHYLSIERKCFAEWHIGTPLDYKFWCFNGRPIYCTVNSNIGENGSEHYFINWYDMTWRFVNYSRLDHSSNSKMLDAKPSKFNQMKEYASVLSADFRFVRLDFYEVDGTVYLGEMTFTPATGFIKWRRTTDDLRLGNMLTL